MPKHYRKEYDFPETSPLRTILFDKQPNPYESWKGDAKIILIQLRDKEILKAIQTSLKELPKVKILADDDIITIGSATAIDVLTVLQIGDYITAEQFKEINKLVNPVRSR